MAAALAAQGRLPAQIGIVSALAILPALLGMVVGRNLRAHLSEATFRHVFFGALVALGTYILARALFA